MMKYAAVALLALGLLGLFAGNALANPATVQPGQQYLAPYGAALITNNGTQPIVVTTTQGMQPPNIVAIVIEGEDEGPADNLNVQIMGCPPYPCQVVWTGSNATVNHGTSTQTTSQVTGNTTTVHNATTSTPRPNGQGQIVTTSSRP